MRNNLHDRRQSALNNQPARFNFWDWLYGAGQWG